MRVLIADDCSTTRRVLDRNLRDWGFETEGVSDGAAALRALRAPNPPRIVLLDWSMPELEGPEVCRVVREEADQLYTYVIFLTAHTRHEDVVRALEVGADCYLTKPVVAAELRQRIRAGQRIIELQDRLLATQEHLQLVATHDQLTGLFNRGALMRRLEQELERSRRIARPVSLILLDLDRFKTVNDRYGHLAGDTVLRKAANRMHNALRSYDVLGRFGGEEFVAVLPETNETNAATIAERMRAAVTSRPHRYEDQAINVTVSLGVAATEPDQYDSGLLIRKADRALLQAKSAGLNLIRVCCQDEFLDPNDLLANQRTQ